MKHTKSKKKIIKTRAKVRLSKKAHVSRKKSKRKSAVNSLIRQVKKVLFATILEVKRELPEAAMYSDDNEYRDKVLSFETQASGTARRKFWRFQKRLA